MDERIFGRMEWDNLQMDGWEDVRMDGWEDVRMDGMTEIFERMD